MKLKIRIFSLLLAAVMLAGMAPASALTVSAEPASGEGENAEPAPAESETAEEPALTASEDGYYTVTFRADHPNGSCPDPEPRVIEVPAGRSISSVIGDPQAYYLGYCDGYYSDEGEWYRWGIDWLTGEEKYIRWSFNEVVDTDFELVAMWEPISLVEETDLDLSIYEGERVGSVRIPNDVYRRQGFIVQVADPNAYTGTYAAGQEYTLVFRVSAEPYHVLNKADLPLTVNGVPVQWTSLNWEQGEFSVTLTAQPPSAVTEVSLELNEILGDPMQGFPYRLTALTEGCEVSSADLLPEGTYDPDDREAVWENETYQIGIRISANSGYIFSALPSLTFNGSSNVVSYERISDRSLYAVVNYTPSAPLLHTVRFHMDHPTGAVEDPPAVQVRDGQAVWQYMPEEQYEALMARGFADGYYRPANGWYTRTLNPDGTYTEEHWYPGVGVTEDLDLYTHWYRTEPVGAVDLTLNIYDGKSIGEAEAYAEGLNDRYDLTCNDYISGTYTAGQSYDLTFTLETRDGFEFTPGDFLLKVNGVTVTPELVTEGQIVFRVTLRAGTAGVIDTVRIDLYDIVGDRASGFAQRLFCPENCGYSAYAYSNVGGLDDFDEGVWEAGHTYTLTCTVDADEGFTFSDDTTVVFNGSSAGVTINGNISDDKFLFVTVPFTPAGTYAGPVFTEPDEDVDLTIGSFFYVYQYGGAARIWNWTSDSPGTVSVDEEGYVTAERYGDAVISGTSDDHMYRGVFRVHTRFRDVTDPDQFYYDYIYWGAEEGYTTGYDDGTFRPMNTCNRAAVVTFLWRMAGEPEPTRMATFRDMTGNETFDKAISWAVEQGITTGYSGNLFKPWNTCNRAAIVTFLWRYAGRPEPAAMASFNDMTGNSDFDNAISWAAENGITTGYAGNVFKPWNDCNRLAVMSFLYRYAHLG